MRKTLVLISALVLILSATIAIAGFTKSPSSNGSESLAFYNDSTGDRTFNFSVSCSEGGDSESITLSAGTGDQYYYEGELADLDQQWSVTVTDGSGATVTSSTFSYSGGTFTPGQIGEGMSFETPSPDQVVLKVSK
ncbi:hypothetical protein [Maridesulfovibrio sp.]|uniref:hypothetical protein n=1 Tax=Maridesulfovibrio sp. TaxID=2795000 RepID=UPI002A18A676|nr:hypothetical protein [Maridesulfovibrio sp.]